MPGGGGRPGSGSGRLAGAGRFTGPRFLGVSPGRTHCAHREARAGDGRGLGLSCPLAGSATKRPPSSACRHPRRAWKGGRGHRGAATRTRERPRRHGRARGPGRAVSLGRRFRGRWNARYPRSLRRRRGACSSARARREGGPGGRLLPTGSGRRLTSPRPGSAPSPHRSSR